MVQMLRASILLAEDSMDDALLMLRAFKQEGFTFPIIHVENGKTAVDHLTECCSKQEFPGLVLLDVKMPLMNGFEVLSWARSHPDLAVLPIAMLTNSGLPEDRRRAEELGATAYFRKPFSPPELRALAREIHDRWLRDLCSSG